MTQRLTLGRSKRLRLRRDFERVFAARCSSADSFLIVYAAPNDVGRVRLGIQVGRRFGIAVRRNRVRRLIREAFRLEQRELPTGFDFVCIPRSGGAASLDRYRDSISRLADLCVRRWRRERSGSVPPPDETGV